MKFHKILSWARMRPCILAQSKRSNFTNFSNLFPFNKENSKIQIMDILEFFYENPPEFGNFTPRKRNISSPKTIIYGALNSGKSAVLKNEISALKKEEFLYLNLADLRLEIGNGELDEFKKTPAHSNRNDSRGDASADLSESGASSNDTIADLDADRIGSSSANHDVSQGGVKSIANINLSTSDMSLNGASDANLNDPSKSSSGAELEGASVAKTSSASAFGGSDTGDDADGSDRMSGITRGALSADVCNEAGISARSRADRACSSANAGIRDSENDDADGAGESFFRKLKEFLAANEQISSLFLDNFDGADLEISSLAKFAETAKLQRFIISTRDKNLSLSGFERLEFLPLSFEEFIAFDKRHNEVSAMISAFLSQGGGAKNPFLAPAEILEFEQRLLAANFSRTEILILKECIRFVHASFSANKIYTALKAKIKISKDAVYGTITKLERENFIKFLGKRGEPARAKKLYFSHFNMREILTPKKDFVKKFANVLFCELLGLDAPIFYEKNLDFYLPSLKMGVLIIPFSDADIIFLKFRKILSELKSLGVTSLKVISMANSGRLEIEGIRCDVVPFHEFALSF